MKNEILFLILAHLTTKSITSIQRPKLNCWFVYLTTKLKTENTKNNRKNSFKNRVVNEIKISLF